MKKTCKLFLTVITLCFAACILFRQIYGRSSCLSATDAAAGAALSETETETAAQASAAADSDDYGVLLNASVILDAGHGGNDPGMVLDTIYEKNISLQITEKLQELLTDRGCSVFMTREDDSYISLEDRVRLTRTQKADLFLSIHLNAVDDDTVSSGIESYYNDSACPGSRQLAEAVQSETVIRTGARDRGARGDSGLYVVRKTAVPSCLIEVGFLTSDTERPLLLSDDYQTKIAEGIARGILKYLSENEEAFSRAIDDNTID